MSDDRVVMEEKALKVLREMITDSERCPRLDDRERQFLTSMSEKVERYGKRSQFSPKQIAWIDRLETKIYGVG